MGFSRGFPLFFPHFLSFFSFFFLFFSFLFFFFLLLLPYFLLFLPISEPAAQLAGRVPTATSVYAFDLHRAHQTSTVLLVVAEAAGRPPPARCLLEARSRAAMAWHGSSWLWPLAARPTRAIFSLTSSRTGFHCSFDATSLVAALRRAAMVVHRSSRL